MRIKKIIVDTVEQWNSRLSDVVRKTDKKKEKTQSESTDCTVEAEHSFLKSNESSGSPAITKKIKSLDHSDGKSFFIHFALCYFDILYLEQQDDTASPKCHQRSQSDGTVMTINEESTDSKKDADKKTVKNILSQLLPSSPNLAQIVVSSFNFQANFATIKDF